MKPGSLRPWSARPWRERVGRFTGVGLGIAILVMTTRPADATQQQASPTARSFSFERLNREYTNEVTETEPVEHGGIRIHLLSPQNRVRITQHQLRLTRRPDATYRAQLELEFEGGGQVEADLSIGDATTHLADRVTVPLQHRTFEGIVTVKTTPNGYVFTALELPDQVTVRIESQLAGSVVRTCRVMGMLVPLDCGAVGALLSRVVLPLPDPGSPYFLPFEELTDRERQELDAYLQGGAG